MKLTNKIPLLVSIPLIICFIVLGMANYSSSKDDAIDYSTEGKKHTLDATMIYVDAFFAGKLNFVDKFSKALSRQNIEYDDEIILSNIDHFYAASGLKALFYVDSKTA